MDTKVASSNSEIEMYGANRETFLRLFQNKIKYALAESGYDELAQAKVCGLIDRNLVSYGIPLNGHSGVESSVRPDIVQPVLERLMASGFDINSNEPVLTIFVDSKDSTSRDNIQIIREAACTVLQTIFHIFLVRVYVARNPDSKNQAQTHQRDFSLAILNVVNTDIGGPGIIQLLDQLAGPTVWEQMIISAEAWNRLELHWRHESQWMTQSMHDMANEPQETMNLVTSQVAESTNAITTIPSNDAANGEAYTEEPVSGHTMDANSVEEVSAMLQHPAMAELLASEANRPGIRHPSWNHQAGNDSLLDLVRMQVAGLGTTESTNVPDKGPTEVQKVRPILNTGDDGPPDLA